MKCSKNVNAPCQNEATEILCVRERGPLWDGEWESYPRCAEHPAAVDVAMIARMHPMAETKIVTIAAVADAELGLRLLGEVCSAALAVLREESR